MDEFGTTERKETRENKDFVVREQAEHLDRGEKQEPAAAAQAAPSSTRSESGFAAGRQSRLALHNP